jgi:hypothetical protein
VNKELTTAGPQRVLSIIAASKARRDNIHLTLETELDQNPALTIQCHRDCVTTYTSKHHIKRKQAGVSHERSHSEPPGRTRRSQLEQTFEFKKNCIFCGDQCIECDNKNPSRWREVIQCTTADNPGDKSFKTKILQICDERRDAQANEVRIRILGAPCDLHAADAQYHKDCYLLFMPKRNIQSAYYKTNNHPDDLDQSFQNLIKLMKNDPGRIWTSVELYENYLKLDREANIITRKQLISKLQCHFGGSLVKFDISGCASLLCFRDNLPQYLQLVKVDDSEESFTLGKLKDKIASECQNLPRSHGYDISQFRKSKTIESTSLTLLKFVSSLVSDGAITKASTTLAQSIQAHLTKSYNQTTLGLAVKLHHKFGSKELLTLLHDYGITATYDEVLRFRTSVAIYTGSQPYKLRGLQENGGTLGAWVDNYDLNIFTPNGCRGTHALVIEVTQQPPDDEDENQGANGLQNPMIPRVSKSDMKNTKLSELSPIIMQHYQGPKNPLPPATYDHDGIPYHDAVKRMKDITMALKADTKWLTQTVTSDDDDNNDLPVEWSGYMSYLAREKGFVSKATRYIYGPLIDAPPSHPDTVLTSLKYIEEFIKSHGQKYMHLVVDLQLFKVAIQIKWSDPTRWKYLLVRPGGMHTLMSFLGCVGVLMKDTGLEDILNVAYNGVSSMLSGKAWPKALRGFRMVLTGLLSDYVLAGIDTYDAIEEKLESARSSKTGCLWVDCFIYPVLLAHMFIRAEREANYVLHIYCLTRMVPYFFAAGHWNYARYITWHLIEHQTELDEEALAMFHMGHHVCRHSSGSWNAVFSDQFGEQTYIRHGKAKGGLVGMTLSPDQVTRWVLSHHICNTVSLAMDSMFHDHHDDKYEAKKDRHKDEGKERKKLDTSDRKKIQQELRKYPHPLHQEDKEVLFNIVNGHVADGKVNVHNALSIGNSMAAEFKGTLPTGFYKAIHSKVVTMETMKKGIKIGDKTIYDMEKLYGRLLVISQRRDITLESLFCFELAPLPSSIFDEYGSLRKSAKSRLVHKLAVWVEEPEPEVDVIDGNEMLYQITWPKTGTVKDLMQNFTRAVEREHDVIVVFDRYLEGSIKTHERLRRTGATICHKLSLTLETRLPARDSIMKSAHNKKELIKVFCAENDSQNVQMVGEENSVYKHEEADCNIISYVKFLIIQGHRHIHVVADDTDIFALLVFFCWKWQYAAQISMRKSDGRVIDINATAQKLGHKSLQLLAVHAITGCDTVGYLFGKGKADAVSIMMKHEVGLEVLGEQDSNTSDVITAGHKFMSILYKEKQSHTTTSMNELRHAIFVSRKDTPKIKSLPPTDPALNENIMRAHLQTMLWKASDQLEPPDVNISDFGWDIVNGIPNPRTGVSKVAPPELMKVVACSCRAQNACSKKTCSCNKAGVSCTSFCKCMAQDSCNNPHTKHDENDSDSESEDSEEE